MKTLVLLDKNSELSEIPPLGATVELKSITQFLTEFESLNTPFQVVNLCKQYRYLSSGYYGSLMVESYNRPVLPSVRTMQDIKHQADDPDRFNEANVILNKAMKRFADLPGSRFSVMVYMGQSENRYLEDLGQKLYEIYPAPILKVDIQLEKIYEIKKVSLIGFMALTEQEKPHFIQSLKDFVSKRRMQRHQVSLPHLSLGILVNPDDKLPPSDSKALAKFIKIGAKLDIDCQLIEKKDYSRLLEFDALFIRETTSITDHTYKFALKAEQEGLPVIDSPQSIISCTNKIYLHHLFQKNKIPVPKTTIFHERKIDEIATQITYPIVIKIPDGNFSRGVHKANSEEEFKKICTEVSETTELILAQEFMPTQFDWRIGVLNGKALYVCRYWMVKDHWQIYHATTKGLKSGDSDAIPVEQADPALIELAERSAKLIGDGLYGVDIKQSEGGYYLIEINDNPSLDSGVEDEVLGDKLYETVLLDFKRRVYERWS